MTRKKTSDSSWLKMTFPLVGFLLPLALIIGCGESQSGLRISTARFPLEGPCPVGNSSEGISTEITKLEVVVSGPDMDDTTTSGEVGTLVLDDVPVGIDRQIVVYGYVGELRAWRGITNGIEVLENQAASVDVLLTKVAGLTCPKNSNLESKAFHTATVLQDGRVLLVGGASSNTDAAATCAGCRRLTASTGIEIYDPSTGIFSPMQSLTSARMLHTASLLSDGRVLIFGGASETLVVPPDAATPFPMKPLLMVPDVEVVDPINGSVSAVGSEASFGRVFHAATATASGKILISGGITAAGTPHNLANALETTIVCQMFSANISCIGASPMTRRRAGHSLHTLDDGSIVAWGGAVSVVGDDGLPVWQVETYDEGTLAWTPHEVIAMSAQRNLFFAATSQYLSFRILAAGGLNRAADGSFDFARLVLGGLARGPVLVLDTYQEESWGVASGLTGREVMGLDAPRFFSSAAALYGEKRALIAGGFTTMQMRPSTTLDFFDESTLSVTTLSVEGNKIEMREARGGLVVSNLGNGTLLLSGGQTGDSGNQGILMTSEIYTDIIDPSAGE